MSSSLIGGSSAEGVRPSGSGMLDEDDSFTGLPSESFDSKRYESFPKNADGDDSSKLGFDEKTPYVEGDDVFISQPVTAEAQYSLSPEFASGGGFPSDMSGNGLILPLPGDMQREEGFALREWRRQNAIRLEEKKKREKEIVKEILQEAEEYKTEFYSKWKLRVENNKAAKREEEKLFLESREKFHAEVSKSYWKAIAELIPKEIPIMEKKGKKDKEKKPTIVVIQGPKPGKPTDLSRMRQILVKLKHNPPPHMKPPPSPSPSPSPSAVTPKDVKTATDPAVGKATETSSTTAK